MHISDFLEGTSDVSLPLGFQKYLDLFSTDMVALLQEVGQVNSELQLSERGGEHPKSCENDFATRLLKLSSDYRCPASLRLYTDTEICLSLALMVYLNACGIRARSLVKPFGDVYIATRMRETLYRLSQAPCWLEHADLSLWMLCTMQLTAESSGHQPGTGYGWRSIGDNTAAGMTNGAESCPDQHWLRDVCDDLFAALNIQYMSQLSPIIDSFLGFAEIHSGTILSIWSITHPIENVTTN